MTECVPEIRFKGFTDAWEQRKLIDIVYRITEMSNKMGLPRVEYEDINSGLGTLNKDLSGKHCNKQGVLFQADDVLFGKLRPYLKNWLMADFSGIAVGDFWVLRSFDTDSGFIYTLIQSDVFDKVANRSTGTKMPRADWSLVSNTYFEIPHSKAEQHQIGTFFHQIDNLITLHQCKCEKLQQIKKAMLEKMFPKEGSSFPEIRFKGFTEPWEQRKAEDVCSISTGKSNTQDHVDDGIYPFYVRSPIIERSNRFLFDDEAVLTVGDGVGTGKVFHYVHGKYDLHQRVYRMFGFRNGMYGKYYYYYFSSHFYARVMAMTAKTSVDSVRYEMIAKMDVLYPNEEEQVKILVLFSNLDSLITLHQRKLESLKRIKKSLLDKMFPKEGEIIHG